MNVRHNPTLPRDAMPLRSEALSLRQPGLALLSLALLVILSIPGCTEERAKAPQTLSVSQESDNDDPQQTLTIEEEPEESEPGPLDFPGSSIEPLLDAAFYYQYRGQSPQAYVDAMEALLPHKALVFTTLSGRYASLDIATANFIPPRKSILGLMTQLPTSDTAAFFVQIIAAPLPATPTNLRDHQVHLGSQERVLRSFVIIGLGLIIASGDASIEDLRTAYSLQPDQTLRHVMAMQMLRQGMSQQDVLSFASQYGSVEWLEDVFDNSVPNISEIIALDEADDEISHDQEDPSDPIHQEPNPQGVPE